MPPSPVSPIVRRAAGLAARLFYRIDCIGAPPADGPVLLLPNHPNALLDPAIIWCTAERDVRFLAKSTLFAWPVGPVLRGAGAIPVYRRSDVGTDSSRNAEMFEAVSDALHAGDAVCIFPEGVSHSSGRLEPLRTGAARIALSAAHADVEVAMVAVGLNFDHKALFRSRVTIAYGPAFPVRDDVSDLVPWRDEKIVVKELTARIASHIRDLMIEADPTGDSALVERVDRLYASARGLSPDPAERLERRRLIAGGIQRLRVADPERYAEMLVRLRRYDDRLRRFRLRDSQLEENTSGTEVLAFAVRELFLGLVLIPVSIAGLVTFAVPYWLTFVLERRLIHEDDVRATAKVVGGAAINAVWTVLLALVVALSIGPRWGVAMVVAIPVLAVASLMAIERETAVAETIRAWSVLRRTRNSTIERLRQRRSEFADLLDEVHRWLTVTDAV